MRAFPAVVASDLDGTLLCSDGTIDERTRRSVAAAEAAGALVILCTARPARWMTPLAEALGHRGVAICANGSLVWDLHTETAIESFPLEPAVAAEVVALLRAELPGAVWAVERADGFAHEPAYRSMWPVPPGSLVAAAEALVAEPALKLMLRQEGLLADALLARARERVGHLVELTHSNSRENLLEISAAGISKASTLARVCEERGFEPAEVIAFGDMPNDLPMLQWAGYGVAVANAHPDLIAAADEVTAGNDEAGVARVLERLYQQPRYARMTASRTASANASTSSSVVSQEHIQRTSPEASSHT